MAYHRFTTATIGFSWVLPLPQPSADRCLVIPYRGGDRRRPRIDPTWASSTDFQVFVSPKTVTMHQLPVLYFVRLAEVLTKSVGSTLSAFARRPRTVTVIEA